MKINNFILAFMLLTGLFTYSQTELPKIKLTPAGTEPVVVEVAGKSKEEIYQSTLNWIQETYKNPDEVLKANIENEKVRLVGYTNNAFSYSSMGMEFNFGTHYTLEIDFKENKYRFSYIINRFTGSDGGDVAWDYTAFYKKNGDVRKAYGDAIPKLENTMNGLNQSLYDYVTGKTKAEDSNW